MSAFGGEADMTICGSRLSWSLPGVKRTSSVALHMSAYDPKRTLSDCPHTPPASGGFITEDLSQPLYQRLSIAVEIGVADFNSLTIGKQLQRIRKLAHLWHTCPIDQHWNNWNVAGKRSPDFNRDIVFRIV